MLLLLSTIGNRPTPFNLDGDVEIDAGEFNADNVTAIGLGDSELTVVADIGPDAMLTLGFGESNIEDIAELANAFDGIYGIAKDADDCFLTVASFDLDNWTAKLTTANVVIGRKVEGIVENGGNVVIGAKSFYANEATRTAYMGDASGNVVMMSFDSLLDNELEVDWDNTIDSISGGMVVHSYLAKADFAKLTYVGGKKVLVHYGKPDGNVIELAREEFTQVTMARMSDGTRDFSSFITIEDGNVIELKPEDITARLAGNPDMQLQLAGQLGGHFGKPDGSTNVDTDETIETDEAPANK